MRRLAAAVTAFLVSGAVFGGAIPARAAEMPVLGARTTLTGLAARWSVRVHEGTVIDLTPTPGQDGALTPRALEVEGGSGFVGFVLSGRGATAGHIVLAVQMPDPDPSPLGLVAATGWGRAADGVACTRCELPGGTYDLELVTFSEQMVDQPPPPTAEVVLTATTSATDGLALTAADGRDPTSVQGVGPPLAGPIAPPAPVWPYIGGFWDSSPVDYRDPVDGVMVDQMTFSISGQVAPAFAAVVEFCRYLPAEHCEDHRIVAEPRHLGVTRATPFSADGEQELSTRIAWDIVGDAQYRYRVRNSTLWIDLTVPPVS